MKFLFSLFLLTPILLSAQKHDYNWVFGYPHFPEHGGMTVDFNRDSFYYEHTPQAMNYTSTSVQYSDFDGNLMLQTNGCFIGDANGDTIKMGAGMNPGTNAEIFCPEYGLALNLPQYVFFLEHPTRVDSVYLIHSFLNSFIDSLQYSICYKSANGDWEVVEKNTTFHTTNVTIGGLIPIKHANGRDWWILAQERFSNRFYSFYFGPDGLEARDTVEVGAVFEKDRWHDWALSPKGDRLAIYSNKDDLHLYDFDRCTGSLFNPEHVPIQDTADITNTFIGGCAWSHDGRYIYTTNRIFCYKFDLESPDWRNYSIVAEFDGFGQSPFNTSLGFLERGPDGRIYCKPTSGSNKYSHVIWNPEKEGIESDFRQHYYHTFNIANWPMFPNYRLGPIDGSACDTLGLNNHPMSNFRSDRIGGLVVDFTEVCWYETEAWEWDFGDPASGFDNTSDERYPTHVFSSPGVYEVCLTAKNGNGKDIQCKEVVVYDYVSTDGLVELKSEMLVYPNPTTGLVNWRNLSDTNLNIQTIKVFDSLGRLVKNTKPKGDAIDLSALSNGLYRLVFFDEKGRVVFGGNVVKMDN